MRTLSATLEAAQKKPDRLPFVEATIYDFEQGIKRLTWSRLYEGSESDNHHGIAFDGQESMYRIRTDAGREYKKLIGQDDQTIAASVAADYHWTDKFTAAASGTMDLFRIKCSGSGNVKLAIYADEAGSPGALLNALDTDQAVVAGWNEIAFPATELTQGTVYWLSFTSDSAIVGRWSESANTKKYKSVSYSGFSFPDPAGSFDGSLSNVPDLTAGWQASTGGTSLYYQKIKDPYDGVLPSFPLSFPISLLFDYSDWQLIAADCAGPCAIAACGAKVYIFYKNTSNVLWKYYSHDYGDTWSNAQLVSYADVLSMAATWWLGSNPQSPTPTVVCFALKSDEINGIVLDTSDQSSSQHTHSEVTHPLLNTYGIGATFDSFWPACLIVFAAKESDTPYNFYGLYRTQFNNTYHFLAFQNFLLAPEGEDITYEYPDCHLPQSPAPSPYETVRITAVEKFTGTTAYTRPLACHLVKDDAFSSATFTEPKPHPVIASGATQSQYGLRIMSTSDYWWLSRPDGVWQAPRPAGDPLDLTPDILSLTQRLGARDWGLAPSLQSLVLELDNSRGQYATPGSGSLAALKKRSELVLKLGYKTSAGSEAVEVGRYWIDAWEYSSVSLRGASRSNLSTLTLYCLDGHALSDRWTARYHSTWGQGLFPGYTVWQILHTLLCRWGIRLWNKSGVPQSSAINNFYPTFSLQPGTGGDAAVRRLLSFVPDGLIYEGRNAWTKDLQADEASCYSYDVIASGAWQSHPILSGEYSHHVHASRARAIGRDDSDNRILEETLNFELLELGIDILRQDYDPNLQSATRTQERADAILRKESLRAERGNLIVPVNCGQELYDVITVTDERCGISEEKYRVMTIETEYDRRQGRYEQKLTLGAP